MSNSFLSVKEIARQALPRLIENLVFPNLVYKDYSGDFQVGKGATIQVRKPVMLTAQTFSSTTSAQDIKEQSVDVTLDTLADVSVEYGAVAAATSVDDLNRLFIEPAAVALATKINRDGLKLAANVPYMVGTAGTTPDGLDDFANAAKVLNEHNVPTTERYGVWDPAANAAFQQLAALVNAEKSGTTEALRAGAIGRVFGIDNYMAQGIAKYTKTGAGTVLVDNSGGYAAGTKQIHVDGVSTALAVGDRITIGSSPVRQYVIVAAGELSTADQDITLDHGLEDAVADNAAITLIGNAVQNLVFHRNAFAFVTRPLDTPKGVEAYTTSYNGISLRVVRGYDMTYKKDMLSMDVLYGYKAIYPELACVVLG